MPALGVHSFLSAGNSKTGILIDALDDIVNFSADSLSEQIMVDVVGFLVPQVSGEVNNHGGHDHDLIIPVENDCTGFTQTGMLFDTLNGICQVAPCFQRFDQIQEFILGFFKFGLDSQLVIDGQNIHIGNGYRPVAIRR